jgi:hypothetical protein
MMRGDPCWIFSTPGRDLECLGGGVAAGWPDEPADDREQHGKPDDTQSEEDG